MTQLTDLSELPDNSAVPVTDGATALVKERPVSRIPKRIILAVLGIVIVLVAILGFTGRTIQQQNLASYLTQCMVQTLGATARVYIYTLYGTLTPTPSTTPLVPAAVAQLVTPTITPTPLNGIALSSTPSPTIAGFLAPDAALGKVVFTTSGCSACHDVTGKHVTVGPSLTNIVTMAKALFPDSPVESYLRQSIIEPDRYTSPGYPAGVMPKNYQTLLTNAQINNVIAYLMTMN
jgi:mono/diheme cytochrome c family protein